MISLIVSTVVAIGLRALDDLDDRDQMRRVRPVHADHAVRLADALLQGGDGNTGGVGGEDGARLALLRQLLEDGLLDLQPLRHGLDHEIGVADRFGLIGGEGDAPLGRLGLLGGQESAADQRLEDEIDRALGLFDLLILDIGEIGVEPVAGERGGHPRPHGPGSDNGDGLDVLDTHWCLILPDSSLTNRSRASSK